MARTTPVLDDDVLNRRGGNGNDTLIGNFGDDLLDEGNDDDPTLGGEGDDLVAAGWGDDTIWGDNGHGSLKGDDRLSDGAGNDLLIDGVEADVMHIGVRNGQIDVLVFESFADSRDGSSDRIHDFERGIDKIDLSRMDGGIHQEGNQQLTWGGSSPTANGVWVTHSLFKGPTIWANSEARLIANPSIPPESDFSLQSRRPRHHKGRLPLNGQLRLPPGSRACFRRKGRHSTPIHPGTPRIQQPEHLPPPGSTPAP